MSNTENAFDKSGSSPPAAGAHRKKRKRGVGDGVPEKVLLHVSEAAEMLGLGRSKVYEMANSGQLPVVRIGAAVRIPKQRLLEWIDEHTLEVA